MEVNRCLDDPEMDRIDHALGRPVDPRKPSQRNGYSTNYRGKEAKLLEVSPLWRRNRASAGQTDLFHVTDEGRAVLAEYLEMVGEPHRKFVVTFDGHAAVVVAVGHSQARYKHFLEVSDVIRIGFRDFCRRTTVRVI